MFFSIGLCDFNNSENLISDKSFAFAIRIIRVYKHLCTVWHEFVLSKQLLRSGTSIGANISEARHAQSRPDFISKMSIALKEADETDYWIRLLNESDFLTNKEAESILRDCNELIAILSSIE